MCPDCGRPIADCICRKQAARPQGDGVVRVRRETQGRKGKTVTTISGLPLGGDKLQELASAFKRQCGAGGSVKEGIVVIQGDHRDTIIGLLQKQGYKVKRAGG